MVRKTLFSTSFFSFPTTGESAVVVFVDLDLLAGCSCSERRRRGGLLVDGKEVDLVFRGLIVGELARRPKREVSDGEMRKGSSTGVAVPQWEEYLPPT
jgi:hypothetical protein